MNSILPWESAGDPGELTRQLESMTASEYQVMIRDIWDSIPSHFPMATPSPDQFWQMLAIAVHADDGPAFAVINLSLIRLLTDTLRRYTESILNDAVETGRTEAVRLMDRAAVILHKYRDPACAMTWIRRCGDLLVHRGDPIQAFPYYSTVINWCTRMSIHNQIDRGQVLDDGIHNSVISADHPVVEMHLSDAAQYHLPKPHHPMLCDCLLLMNSIAQIHLARNTISRTREWLDRADDLLNQAADGTDPIRDFEAANSRLPAIRLRLLTTRLRCSLLSGDLASAEIASSRGMRLMQHLTDPRDPARLDFRLQAGEFLYRIRNLSELDRLFPEILSDERNGLQIDPGQKAEMLTNWAMAFRERHYIRLAARCHRHALALFESLPGQCLQAARIRVQIAELRIRQKRFDEAESELTAAETGFETAPPSIDTVRLHIKRSELYRAQSRLDQALKALNTGSDTLAATGMNHAPLALALACLKAQIVSEQNDGSRQAVDAVQHAASMVGTLKNDLIHFTHRWRFSGIYRDSLIRRLGMAQLPVADRVAGVLDIIESDRADIFSTSLPYLVKFSRHPGAGKLYSQYMDVCRQLMNESNQHEPETDWKHQRILTDIRALYSEILTCHDLSPGALAWTPTHPTTIQAHLARHYAGRNAIALAYVLADEQLVAAVIPASGPFRLITVPTSDSLRHAADAVHTALTGLTGTVRNWLDTLATGNACCSIPWRVIGDRYFEKLRRWRRKRHTRSLRGMVEASILLMEAGLIYQRIRAMDPMKSRHPAAESPDRSAYAFLHRVLIDPVQSCIGDNTDLIVFASGILSQIPVEALIHPTADGRDEYLIFPARTVNYFRSPALFHRVMTAPYGIAVNAEPSRSWFTPHIGANQQTNPYEPGFPTAACCGKSPQHDLWFRAHEATAAAFERHAPACHDVLLETHATFDRFQPFLSRMMFALSEPYTVMDILSKLTFQTTSLMILVGCESDRIHDDSLDDAGISLSEAILCKGAEQVLATKWLVDAKFCREFIRDVQELIRRGNSAPDALAQAQRARASYSGHPGKWAAFSFSGRPEFNHRDTIQETLP
ncbi:CHAT domain-containing protein [bacterium]|nr:CHAT domain-containing protein [candidate division CSSED10-310 bacterium]